MCECVTVERVLVYVSVTTLVSVEKPLEVRSWVREYLKQAVRQVFEDENEDSDSRSTQYPVSKKWEGKCRNVIKVKKEQRSQIRCYL